MKFHRIAAACFILAGMAPAFAEITVLQAEYGGGVLVVRGESSKPDQRITLDGRFDTYSDRLGKFVFRIRYLPRDCMVLLRAGQEERPAAVTNCEPVGPLPSSTLPPDGGRKDAVSVGMRVVRQQCGGKPECSVTCRTGEYAINAMCSDGAAQLRDERTVSCPPRKQDHIVAYCLMPQGATAR